ncbi:hypothetical protein D9M68_521840 [compost metagenome]
MAVPAGPISISIGAAAGGIDFTLSNAAWRLTVSAAADRFSTFTNPPLKALNNRARLHSLFEPVNFISVFKCLRSVKETTIS